MKYVIDRPQGLSREDMPERVQEWLRANGHPAAEVISTAYYRETGNVRIVVESDTDPTVAVEVYTPTPTAKEIERKLRLDLARAVAAAARANPNAPRTPQEINSFISALAELMPELKEAG